MLESHSESASSHQPEEFTIDATLGGESTASTDQVEGRNVPVDLDDPENAAEEMATEETATVEPTADEKPTTVVLASIEERLARIESGVYQFNDRARELEGNNLKMHDLVSDLRSDSVVQALKPALERLASLNIQALNCAEDSAGDGTARTDFLGFADEIDEIFSFYDFHSVDAHVGVPFDRSFHAAVQRKKTNDPELEGRIARVIRQGYAATGSDRAFLHAQVAVYRYKKPVEPAEEPYTTDETFTADTE